MPQGHVTFHVKERVNRVSLSLVFFDFLPVFNLQYAVNYSSDIVVVSVKDYLPFFLFALKQIISITTVVIITKKLEDSWK